MKIDDTRKIELLGENDFEKSFQQSLVIKRVEKALSRIRIATVEEAWLPIGLRSIVAELIQELDTLIGSESTRLSDLARRVHGLTMALVAYGDVIRESKVVRSIRVLDLELDAYRKNTNKELFGLGEYDEGDQPLAMVG